MDTKKLLVYRVDLKKTFKDNNSTPLRWNAFGKEVKQVTVTPYYVDIIYLDKIKKYKVI